MVPQWIIEKKRDGFELDPAEIAWFINAFTHGEIADYQASALLMAAFIRGLSSAETSALTEAMLRSGDTLPTQRLSQPRVDKHSTGGIGDKVSLILAPMLAACGVAVPMISGRGLGITGGTLDKLEAIPGYRTQLSDDEVVRIVEQCGCSIAGQSARLCPADKKLYALRDVTATVPSIPLIVASIMSKKLAENLNVLVLDVKWGRGAFMKQKDQARALAQAMVNVGESAGVKTRALLTDMNEPLGRSAGNALEVVECIEALRGKNTDDLMQVTLELWAHALVMAGVSVKLESARSSLTEAWHSGEAFRRFRRMVELHGGDVRLVDDPGKFEQARCRESLRAARSGFVSVVDAEKLGMACLMLGVGRRRAEDAVDASAGLSRIVKTGERVQKGDRLLDVHGATAQSVAEAIKLLSAAIEVTETAPGARELIAEVV